MQENIKLVTVKKTVRQAYRTEPIWQYDVGHVLNLEGFDNLPETFQMHYSHSPMGDAITQIGSNGQVSLPDEFAQTSAQIFAWVYVAEEDTGLTKYTIEIPVMRRARITNQEPTPVEQSAIDQAISALNAGVSRAETAAANAESSEDAASASAESAYRSSEAAAGAAESAAGDASAAERSATAAGESASAAATSAANASGSATTAGNAATAAQGSAQTAQAAAQTATQKSGEAVSSANSAAASALSAGNAAQTATQKANDATSAATAAQGSASAASGSATAAAGSASAAAQTKTEIDDEVDGFQAQITNLSSAINQKIDSPETPGTAGQVLGLDANLDPVWTDQEEVDVSGLAPVIKSTASGEIASFSDGADGRQIDSLVVNITPVQDLHGQEAPYPPGGGKNKLNAIEENIIYYNTSYNKYTFSDGVVTITGNVLMGFVVPVQPSTQYTASFYKNNTSDSVSLRVREFSQKPTGMDSTGYIQQPVNNSSTNNNISGTFTTTAETTWVIVCVYRSGTPSETLTISNWQLEAGSARTAYAPYSNVCPISGWTGCDVNQTGINLFDGEMENGEINSTTGENNGTSTSRYRSKNYIPIKAGQYYFKSPGRTGTVRVFSYDINKTFLGFGAWDVNAINGLASEKIRYIRFLFGTGAVDGDANISINYPASDTSYHAYTGTTLPISWQSVAGTVYGGSLTINSDGTGKLVVGMASVTVPQRAGSVSQLTNTTRFIINRLLYPNWYKIRANIISNMFVEKSYNTDVPSFSHGDNSANVYFKVPKSLGLTTADEINAWLGNNLIQLVYPLEEPITYDLTDLEVLETLKGINNIWADCGSIANVEYSADTKTYIDDSVPAVPVQDVQVNGVSVLTDGVANVPIADGTNPGVVKVVRDTWGLFIHSTQNYIGITKASDANVKAGSNSYNPIVPNNQHQSVFYGLAKLAGVDMASSSNPVGTYTDAAKVAIQKMLGIYEPPYELLNDITLQEEGQIDLTADNNGTPYNLLGVYIYVTYPANTPTASAGYGRYYLYDSNGIYITAETGKYATSTSIKFKHLLYRRTANLSMFNFTSAVTTGSSGNWQCKPYSTYTGGGVKTEFGERIVRIAMPTADVEPAGTRIQIFGQRAY